jgi:hypothetical protein
MVPGSGVFFLLVCFCFLFWLVGIHEEKYAISHKSFDQQALVKNILCEKYASHNAVEDSQFPKIDMTCLEWYGWSFPFFHSQCQLCISSIDTKISWSGKLDVTLGNWLIDGKYDSITWKQKEIFIKNHITSQNMGDSFYHIFTTNIPILYTLFFGLRGLGIQNVISKNYHMSVITLISRKICDKISQHDHQGNFCYSTENVSSFSHNLYVHVYQRLKIYPAAVSSLWSNFILPDQLVILPDALHVERH